MANYVSGYSGEQLEAVLDLFVNKGLGSVTGLVKRKADGSFEVGSTSSGTVTSVSVVNATNGGISVSGSPITSSGTITIGLESGYGDTKNPYGTKTKNYVLAGPTTGSNAAPTFRALVAADIPDLSGIYLTSHQDISGKADKTATVSTVTWDTNNKKLTKTINGTTTDVVTIDTIKTALNLPDPMVFKGSLGTGGTITTLPAASSSNKGYTYKVITDGTYASQAAKVGDTFISDGSAWVLIPSGDEPSGTVTSVATGTGLTGGPITSSGTISLDTSGATAGSYGPSADVSPGHSGTFSVPYVTVDTYGRVTSISTTTITLPASGNTDQKLKVAEGTSGTQYYPIFGSGTSAATRQYDTKGLAYKGTAGTTSAVGTATLTLGNSTASGTAANKRGQLVVYGSTAYAHTIEGAPTAARTLTLPDKTGTLVTTDDLPTSAASGTTGVTISDHSTTTIYGVQSGTTTASKASGGNGTVPSLTYAIDGTDSHQLNITWSAGSASTWSFSDVTVPKKNSSTTTVVTGKTHTVNDSGHTHTLA